MDSIFSFVTIALLLVISPGPNGALVFKTVSTMGTKIASANIIGLVLATFVHGTLSILGLSVVIKNIPTLFNFIKILGAVYLFYIGLKAIVSASKIHRQKDKNIARNITSDTSSKKVRSSLLEGFLTQILNPKVSIFYIAAFPQFIDFGNKNFIMHSFLLVSIHAFIIFTWFSLFVFLYEKIQLLFKKSNSIAKYTQLFSGFVLIYFGVLVMFKS